MKKKIFVYGTLALLAAYPALAQTYNCPMSGYGGLGGLGSGPLLIVYAAAAALVFGLVFWGTKKMFDGSRKENKK